MPGLRARGDTPARQCACWSCRLRILRWNQGRPSGRRGRYACGRLYPARKVPRLWPAVAVPLLPLRERERSALFSGLRREVTRRYADVRGGRGGCMWCARKKAGLGQRTEHEIAASSPVAECPGGKAPRAAWPACDAVAVMRWGRFGACREDGCGPGARGSAAGCAGPGRWC